MNNLQRLFETDLAFRSIVVETAARAIGSTSEDFAEKWLAFDAEHVSESEPPASQNVSEKSGASLSDLYGILSDEHVQEMHTLDSRERIVAEIDQWLGSWTAFSVPTSTVKQAVLGWLDRQAAITADEWERALDVVNAERDNLADDLLACNREREHLRNQLGIALDHAHDVLALVDLDGEVVS